MDKIENVITSEETKMEVMTDGHLEEFEKDVTVKKYIAIWRAQI